MELVVQLQVALREAVPQLAVVRLDRSLEVSFERYQIFVTIFLFIEMSNISIALFSFILLV